MSELQVSADAALEASHEITHQGICLVRTLARLTPSWISSSSRIVRYLLAIWLSPDWRNR